MLMKKHNLSLTVILLLGACVVGKSQSTGLLTQFKPVGSDSINLQDMDNDSDPDIIRMLINDTIPAIWIDDDDDMLTDDFEGDTDSDCLLIDRNKDGVYAGPGDLSIDWIDSDQDGHADMQVVVENSNPHIRNSWDWQSNCMWNIDSDNDHTFNFVNWKEIVLRCWTHSGASDFIEDYHGQTLFLKTHVPSYRFSDLRYNWENPFLFYDPDDDGLTEMAIRLEDDCRFINMKDKEIDTYPNKMINRAFLTFDLDNDNAPQNEFDFDMSLYFGQGGFSYENQVHRFHNIQNVPEADRFFYDNRWRKLNELIYPSHDSSWPLIFNEGKWKYCWMVFDEDDDCERWERVEFYEPKSPFITGMNKGGIDNNPQADASGDRGEWDIDNSGNGSLYIGFDGRIHLYGAEKGVWRIDQLASSYQGWGGLYEGQYKREQKEPVLFPTVSYEDSDGDGFFDLISYDLDGDTIFETTVNLLNLKIKVRHDMLITAESSAPEINALFIKAADDMWKNAMLVVDIARKAKINHQWYAFYLSPKSAWQKYNHGYWLQFYLFNDLIESAQKQNDTDLVENIIKAYYGRNWKMLDTYYR